MFYISNTEISLYMSIINILTLYILLIYPSIYYVFPNVNKINTFDTKIKIPSLSLFPILSMIFQIFLTSFPLWSKVSFIKYLFE